MKMTTLLNRKFCSSSFLYPSLHSAISLLSSKLSQNLASVETTNVTTPTNVNTFLNLLVILTFVVGLSTTNVKINDKC